ncbi:Hypothetical protein NocV09_05600080 [Nannochloropsis oceanica]
MFSTGSRRLISRLVLTGPTPAPPSTTVKALSVVSSRLHSTAAEVPHPLSVIPTLASRSADAASKQEALTAWRTRGLIVDAGNNPHKLLGLLEKGPLDANNMVILVTRLAQACEGKEEVKAAVQADARFAQLVARVVGGVEGALEEKLSELQVLSLREGLRVLGVGGV